MKKANSIQLYNTLSGKKELLPTSKKPLRLFVCGPTVYGPIHIGNARVDIVFDIFVRFLRSQNKKIIYLKNITDIDDKIITRAQQAKTTSVQIAKKYTKEYLANMKSLDVISVDRYAPATKYIPEIIKQVKNLIANDNAYEIEKNGIYFDLATFPEYGKLARRTIEQAEDGVSRIDINNKKRNKGDFCLWRFSPLDSSASNGADKKKVSMRIIKGEPAWWSPWSWGRPGWHIEDTAISEKHFGQQYELHGGGLDLKFPHHEAEIAQQESISKKKPFVQTWMHVGMIHSDGKKMSKSIGNLVLVNDFLKTHNPLVLRYIIAAAQYRSKLNYDKKTAEDAKHALYTLYEFKAKLALRIKSSKAINKAPSIDSLIKKFKSDFQTALSDDLNTPQALAALFTFIRAINKTIWNLSPVKARLIQKELESMLQILGIHQKLMPTPAPIKRIVSDRESFRSNEQFIQSDRLRKKLTTLGYTIDDTPLGPLVFRQEL